MKTRVVPASELSAKTLRAREYVDKFTNFSVTYGDLDDSLALLQSELEDAMDQGLEYRRDRLMHAIEAIAALFELRREMNMEPEGASVNEVLAEVRKVYDRDQKLLRAMQDIRDKAVTALQRR